VGKQGNEQARELENKQDWVRELENGQESRQTGGKRAHKREAREPADRQVNGQERGQENGQVRGQSRRAGEGRVGSGNQASERGQSGSGCAILLY
jgi:hypothetical protein